jgi:GH25 family lysozyme M1 (1,4-beta-N-acetylmuramidase)
MVTFTPTVLDIYRGDVVEKDGFIKLKQSGIVGVIHKATQGASYQDATFQTRWKEIEDAGLLLGAYHFNTAENVKAQVDNFFDAAEPDDKTLMVLDYEQNKASDMTIHQMVEFLRLSEEKLGRKLAIYSGNKLKETIDDLEDADFDYVCEHRLWLCQYGPVAKLPEGFKSYWLWQYTDGAVGPLPHTVPGVSCPSNRGGGVDLSVYNGAVEQLIAEWK